MVPAGQEMVQPFEEGVGERGNAPVGERYGGQDCQAETPPERAKQQVKRRFTPKATESLDLQFMQQAPHTPAEDGGHKVQAMEHGQDHEMMSHLRERLALEDQSKNRYFNGDNDA